MNYDNYEGRSFNVRRNDDGWTIWRFTGVSDEKEQIVLADEAMEELRVYFSEFYAEDKELPRF